MPIKAKSFELKNDADWVPDDPEKRFILLKDGDPAFTRIKNPREVVHAQKGKWVWTALLPCEEFAFDPHDLSGMFHKGVEDPALLNNIVCNLWRLIPDIGFAVRPDGDGKLCLGYLCPHENVADFIDDMLALNNQRVAENEAGEDDA